MGFCIRTVLKVAHELILITYKCNVSFRIFDFNLPIFVQTCHWPCLEHQMDDLLFKIHFVELNHEVEFFGCILYLKMPDFWSSALDLLERPQTPVAQGNGLRSLHIVPTAR